MSASITDGMNATNAIGQYDASQYPLAPLYTKNDVGDAPNALQSGSVDDVIIDDVHDRLFVADGLWRRILVFNLNANGTLVDRLADNVLGFSTFNEKSIGSPTPTQSNFNGHANGYLSLAYDSSGDRLFVGDQGFSRVLVFDTSTITNGENATNVIGQTTFTNGGTGIAQNRFSSLSRIAYDSSGQRLFVSDFSNNRVLVFDARASGSGSTVLCSGASSVASTGIADGMNASCVIGQDNFTSGGINRGGGAASASANRIYSPRGLAYASGKLFLSDSGNNRVTIYTSITTTTTTTASTVLGQSATNVNLANRGTGVNQNTLSAPDGLAYRTSDNTLFVADGGNHRVVTHSVASPSTGQNATNVLGQSSFTSATAATTPTQTGLNFLNLTPASVAFDQANNRLHVVDITDLTIDEYRAVIFDTASIADGEGAVDTLFAYDNDTDPYAGGSPTPVFTKRSERRNRTGLNAPWSVSYDPANGRMFVADRTNNRILVYLLGANGALTDYIPDYVLGQADFDSNSTANNGSTLETVGQILYDNEYKRLYVADTNNHRVVVFDLTGGITNGMAGTYFLGQTSDTGVSAGTQQYRASTPSGLALDSVNDRLFVASSGYHRVVVFDVRPAGSGSQSLCGTSTTGIATGMNASCILGQTDFNGTGAFTSQSRLSAPYGLAYEAVSSRLFVSDEANNRVMVFSLSGGISNGMSAAYVLGKADFDTSTPTTATQSNLGNTWGLALDPVNRRLFVGDSSNRRVLQYDVSGTLSNGMNAQHVLGQSTFSAASSNLTQAGMSTPRIPAYNSLTGEVAVPDTTYNRVTLFLTDTPIGVTTSINPTTKNAGDAGFTLTVNGSNFVEGMVVRIDGTARTTTYVNSGQLTASILAGDIASSGSKSITVYNPAPGGADSNAQTLTVNNPSPTLTLLTPDNTNEGGATFDLAVTGTNFTANSVVKWDGSNRTTTFNSSTSLSAQILDTDIATATTASVTVFNPSPGGGTSGALTFTINDVVASLDATLSNQIVPARNKVGATGAYSITFTLQNTLSGVLTVTFPAGFTVTSAPTAPASSGCLSSFGYTAQTMYATKTSCSGTITLGGALVQNPAVGGRYVIIWVNDDPGEGAVYIIDDDQVTVSANVDPYLTFNAGVQDDATACDGTFAGGGGTIALGVLTTGAVTTSDAASVDHVCTRLSTNASSGANVTVRNANGASGLVSTSVPADDIDSASATLTAGTEGYGLCGGSAGGDSGNDAISGAATPARSTPFNGTCTTGSHAVGGLTTTPQTVWNLTSPSQNAFVRLYLKAAISPTTSAHADYTDTLTFTAAGTF